jgi:hypothetical protein
MSKDQERIRNATDLILRYGGIDGAHHKQWCLDQVLRLLLNEKEYHAWVYKYEAPDADGQREYEWDKGTAP